MRARADLDVVEHGEPGKQREALEHHRDALGRALDRLAVERDRALGRTRQAGDDAQQLDLPQPERPSSATISPVRSVSETSCSTGGPARPNLWRRSG